MSQLPESTESTCIDKELNIRALPGKHGKFTIRDISSSSNICINSGGGANSSSIPTTSCVRSVNVDESGFLKSTPPPPPQYSSLHQTKRQMRTQNAYASSNSSLSNNCDSKNLNEITTTVTSQIGVPATVESAEGKSAAKCVKSQTRQPCVQCALHWCMCGQTIECSRIFFLPPNAGLFVHSSISFTPFFVLFFFDFGFCDNATIYFVLFSLHFCPCAFLHCD